MSAETLLSALRSPPEVLLRLAAVPGLHIVGGWLRAAWYGEASHDFDLSAAADFESSLAQAAGLLGCAPFSLNERFATSRFMLDDGSSIDLQPQRGASIVDDLAQRDYTVNTLCLPLSALGAQVYLDALVHDPRALDDLESRTLRMVSRDALADDPLRIVRGYRFAATLGLQPTDETRAAWHELRAAVPSPAAERIHEELLRWFDAPPQASEQGPGLPLSLRWAAEDGVLWQLFPALRDSDGCTQNTYHHLDVWNHTLLCLQQLDRIRLALPGELNDWQSDLELDWDSGVGSAASAGVLTRIALMLHDVAKPATRELQPDGRISFHGHQEDGAVMARTMLERLKFSGDETDYVCRLVGEHLRLGFYSDRSPMPARLIYRFIRALGSSTPLMVLHSLADCAATQGEEAGDNWQRHLRAAREVLGPYYSADQVAAPPLLLDGHAIMALLGLPPGRRIGALKEALLEATAAGEVTTVEEAVALVSRLAQE